MSDGSPVIVSGKPWFHAERYMDADSSTSGGNISKEEFGEAVVNSGLV